MTVSRRRATLAFFPPAEEGKKLDKLKVDLFETVNEASTETTYSPTLYGTAEGKEPSKLNEPPEDQVSSRISYSEEEIMEYYKSAIASGQLPAFFIDEKDAQAYACLFVEGAFSYENGEGSCKFEAPLIIEIELDSCCKVNSKLFTSQKPSGLINECLPQGAVWKFKKNEQQMVCKPSHGILNVIYIEKISKAKDLFGNEFLYEMSGDEIKLLVKNERRSPFRR